MATIEIDENEYAQLKRVADVAAAIERNPKARVLLQGAVEEAVPDQVGPEIRIRREVNEKLSGVEKMMAEFIESQKAEAAERKAADERRALEQRWAAGRSKALASGYTDEGLKELEDFMEKNGVADHELAIPAFERLHPPPEPVVTGGSRWDFFGAPKEGNADVGLEALMRQDYDAFEALAIPAALKDVRR